MKTNNKSINNTNVSGGNNMTNEMIEKVAVKVAEMEALVEKKSSNKNPDFYKTQKEYNLWKLVVQALEGDVDEAFLNKLLESKGGNKTVIEVHEGDKLMDLLNKYSEVKDIYNKITKACAENGLKVVLDHIERA